MDFDDEIPDKNVSVDSEEVKAVLLGIQSQLTHTDEDQDQNMLIDAIQQYRTMLLNYTTTAFLKKPNNPKMLEAVTALVAQLEKSVRDDRKEKAKKKENDDNKLSFNQMLEAMKQISSGEINIPTFTTPFILDPNQSLIAGTDIKPIGDAELEMGNSLIDIDGNPM